ncbi:LysR family transcriptional regulator [Acinetobacter ihumii]|uniref:LysR family transcriptional regulator n=1 Tax=Acinetobacter ihumii TaxID=2483802 RepID=UPI001031BE15|nr:LysR family transcriptional regulator [Acinetobacter ihumii]
MELRHIRYFLVVADEKSFTRAAQRLGISQPPLSMQIKHLEDEIGTELFFRSAHGADLTPAGEAFLNAVQSIQQRVDDAVNLAQQVANGELGQLRLGFTGTAMLNPVLPHSVRLFQQQYPKIQLRLEEGNSLLLIDRLLNDQLDIALIRPPQHIPADLHILTLMNEPLVVVMPLERVIEKDIAIQLQTLKHENFIMAPRSVSAGLHDAVLQACRSHGLEPKIGQNAPQILSIVSLVAANLGVSLVPVSAMQLGIKGVQYLDVAEPKPAVGFSLAYRRNTHSQAAINFSSLIQSLVKTLD